MDVNGTKLQMGDLGSKVLPPTPSMASWARGAVVEATWSMRANHGGGKLELHPPTMVELRSFHMLLCATAMMRIRIRMRM